MTRANVHRVLAEFSESPSDGAARVLSLEGPAGIGKTTLARRYVPASPVCHWAVAAGESVAEPYAVLEQLFSRLRQASDPSAAALATLAPHVAGLSLLDAVSNSPQPQLLVIDDAQWADVPSIAALAFAIRRSYSERLRVIFCVREAEPLCAELTRLLEDPVTTRLSIPGLDPSEVAELAEQLGSRLTHPRTARLLSESTGGNPLWLSAVLRDGGSATLPGRLDSPLRPPPTLARLIQERLERCSPDAQRVVEAVAVIGPAPRTVVLDVACAGGPILTHGLAEALAEGLVEEVPAAIPTVAPAHDLVSSTVYHAMDDERRRALHARAGAALPDSAAGLRHRSAAVVGADPMLCDALVTRAEVEAQSQRWSLSAELRLLAARHEPSQRAEQEQILMAAADLLRGGDHTAAAALTEQIVASPPSPLRSRLLGSLALFSGHLDEAETHLLAAWEQRDTAPSWVGASAAAELSVIAVNQGHGELTRAWAQRAVDLSPQDPMAHVMLGMAEGVLAIALPASAGAPNDAEVAEFAGAPHALAGVLLAAGCQDGLVGGGSRGAIHPRIGASLLPAVRIDLPRRHLPVLPQRRLLRDRGLGRGNALRRSVRRSRP